MSDWIQPAPRPVLVAASGADDAAVARSAVEELRLPVSAFDDAVTAMRALCREPAGYAAVVAGELVGRATGLSFCGLVRDAGIALPVLLLTSVSPRSIAERAARLRLTLLWQPAPSWLVTQTLRGMLPRRVCGSARGSGAPRLPFTAPCDTSASRSATRRSR